MTETFGGGFDPIPEPTPKDIRRLDAALADEERRHVAEVALALAARIVDMAPELRDEGSDLPESDREILAGVGIATQPSMSNEEFHLSRPVLEGMARRTLMTVEALPLSEAARGMGVNGSRLRQRIAQGSLLAIPRPHGRGWLIPAFQLTDEGELPHLGRVLMAATWHLSAETLDRFFTLPHDDLEDMSPRDWLVAGRDPAPLEAIVAGL